MEVPGQKHPDYHGSVSHGSAEDFKHSCHSCLTDGQHEEAHGYCVDCQEYLCINCFRYHRRTTALKNHQLLDKDNMDKHDVSAKPPEICTEKCTIHGNEIIKFFCLAHEALGCTDCITMNHRNCDIDYIPDKCAHIENTEEYSDVKKELDKKIANADAVIKTANEKDSVIDACHNQAVQDMDKFHNDIVHRLQDHKEKIRADADKRKSEDQEKVKKVITSCTALSSDTNLLKSKIADCKAANQPGQLFIAIKRAKATLKSEELYEAEEYLDKTDVEYTFEQNKALENMLARKDAFGQLICSKARPSKPSDMKTPGKSVMVDKSNFPDTNNSKMKDNTHLMGPKTEDKKTYVFHHSEPMDTGKNKKSDHSKSMNIGNSKRPEYHSKPNTKDNIDIFQKSNPTKIGNSKMPEYHSKPNTKDNIDIFQKSNPTETGNSKMPEYHSKPNTKDNIDIFQKSNPTETGNSKMPEYHSKPNTKDNIDIFQKSKPTDTGNSKMSDHSKSMNIGNTELSDHSQAKDTGNNRVDKTSQPQNLQKKCSIQATKPIQPYTLRPSEYMNVTTETDLESCGISGCAMLSSQRLLLADTDNMKLKIVNLQRPLQPVVEEKVLEAPPRDIAALPKDEAAVTIPNQKKILIVLTAGKLSIKNTVNVEGICRGVTYYQDCLYVVCWSPYCVFVLTMDGSIKYAIALPAKFLSPHYIAFNPVFQLIYVSDTDRHSICSLTLQGDTAAVYRDKGFRPTGMVMLDDGSLLVCNQYNNRICCISGDLKQEWQLTGPSRRQWKPLSIYYSSAHRTVYIGASNSGQLKTFILE